MARITRAVKHYKKLLSGCPLFIVLFCFFCLFVCLFFDVVACLFFVFVLFCFLKRKKKKLLFQINENHTNFFSESKPGDKKKLREDKDWTVSNSTHPAPC